MKKVSEAVHQIVKKDEIAFEALRRGILNLSAYAEEIHQKVEDLAWKAVNKGTIVVALSRLSDHVQTASSFRPKILLDDLVIRSPLCDISFRKTEDSLRNLRKFQASFSNSQKKFVMITQSVREITVILPSEARNELLTYMHEEPIEIFDDLVGLTLSFDPHYLSVPNVVFTIIAELALERINLRELVSTYTEISVIIDKKDMQRAVEAVQVFFDKDNEESI